MNDDRRRWNRLLKEQARSRLSIVEFCRIRGMSPSTFHRWRRELALSEPAARFVCSAPSFVECAAPTSISIPPLVIALRGGRRLEVPPGTDESWVARLAARLERADEEGAS